MVHRHSHHSSFHVGKLNIPAVHMAKLHVPAVHMPKSHYKFGTFVKDISVPIKGVAKEFSKTVNHSLDVLGSFGKVGSSLATPLIIIGVAGIAFIVVNKGAIR